MSVDAFFFRCITGTRRADRKDTVDLVSVVLVGNLVDPSQLWVGSPAKTSHGSNPNQKSKRTWGDFLFDSS